MAEARALPEGSGSHERAVPGRELRARQEAAGSLPAGRPRRLEGPARPPRRGRPGPPVREGTGARPAASPPRADGEVGLHVLPGRGPHHGLRPRRDAGLGRSRPGLRRRPPLQLRRVRHAGAEDHLLHQRPRRDPPGPVGVGRQAPRPELRRGLPGQRSGRGRGEGSRPDLREHVPRVDGGVQRAEDAGALVPVDDGRGADRGPASRLPQADRQADRRRSRRRAAARSSSRSSRSTGGACPSSRTSSRRSSTPRRTPRARSRRSSGTPSPSTATRFRPPTRPCWTASS